MKSKLLLVLLSIISTMLTSEALAFKKVNNAKDANYVAGMNHLRSQNFDEAIKSFDQSCRTGNAMACVVVSAMHREFKNIKLAEQWENYVCSRSQEMCLTLSGMIMDQFPAAALKLLTPICYKKQDANACLGIVALRHQFKHYKVARDLAKYWCHRKSSVQGKMCNAYKNLSRQVASL